MRRRTQILFYLLTFFVSGTAFGQQSPSSSGAPPAASPADQQAPNPDAAPAPADSQTAVSDPDLELQITVQQAGNDGVALVRNLEAYLVRYPDSPRKGAVYRILAQSEVEAQNPKRALDYAEKTIAIQPDDIQTMYLVITILDKMPDDASQVHAVDYATRLIDLVAKANPESRPEQMTLDDWQAGRNKFASAVYVLRGRMERRLRKTDEATKDFTAGFNLLPSASAAVSLGEIAEEQKHVEEAVRQYATAFLLSGQEQDDNSVDQNSLRLRMGNLWRFTHDSSAGLGDVLLEAYDKNKANVSAEMPEAVVYNKDLTDPLQFSLRRVDGAPPIKLADERGKTVILNFWTTWCAYCRVMEPLLADVRKKFDGRDDVVFLAVDADEEQNLVGPYLKAQKVDGTLVFADGLDQILHVESIPSVVVLDRTGKATYRTQGFAPDDFVDALSGAITKASAGSGK